jgi:hypothetical protein
MEIKTCTRCSVVKEVDNFYIRRTRNSQRKSICKQCESIQKARPVAHVPDLEGEIWKDILGYEGIYLVSNKGRVKRIMHRKNVTNKIINSTKKANDYIFVCLTINGINKDFKTSRLVAIAFIPNPENKPQVNHLNGKDDNTVESLEWNTSKENIRHAWDTGLSKPMNGETNGNSILNEKDVLEIRASSLTPTEISKIYNVNLPAIYKILARNRWKHI